MMKQEEQTDVAARIAESEKTLNEFDNEQVRNSDDARIYLKSREGHTI